MLPTGGGRRGGSRRRWCGRSAAGAAAARIDVQVSLRGDRFGLFADGGIVAARRLLVSSTDGAGVAPSGADLRAGAGMSDTTAFSVAGAPSLLRRRELQHADGDRGNRRGRGERPPAAPVRSRFARIDGFAARAPASRRAAARIAASSDAGGSSRDSARHAAVDARIDERRASSGFGSGHCKISKLEAQLRDGVADAALDGLDAGAGQLGDLRELEPAFLMQQKRFALHRRAALRTRP